MHKTFTAEHAEASQNGIACSDEAVTYLSVIVGPNRLEIGGQQTALVHITPEGRWVEQPGLNA